MSGIIRHPTLGDMVLYRAHEGRSAGEQRPAVVVKVYSDVTVGLHVFDAGIHDSGAEFTKMGFPSFVDSVTRGDDKGQWLWPDG
jgi:hypothetical protein